MRGWGWIALCAGVKLATGGPERHLPAFGFDDQLLTIANGFKADTGLSEALGGLGLFSHNLSSKQ
jgi:hypothetical protein